MTYGHGIHQLFLLIIKSQQTIDAGIDKPAHAERSQTEFRSGQT